MGVMDLAGKNNKRPPNLSWGNEGESGQTF